MGLTAIASSAAGSSAGAGSSAAGGSAVTSLFSTVGAGVGGIFVTVALIYLLIYLDLLSATEGDDDLRVMIAASVIPLFVAFVGIVVFRSLQVI